MTRDLMQGFLPSHQQGLEAVETGIEEVEIGVPPFIQATL
jgi:hypothetical protein